MNLLIVSTSLNPQSKSRLLAEAVLEKARESEINASLIDLRRLPLPLCDGDAVYEDKNVQEIGAEIQRADAIIITVPIYNFNVSAAAKNLIEVTGYAFKGKLVAVLSAAGGSRSFMAVLPFINSIQLDFGAWIVPQFISAREDSFSQKAISDAKLLAQLDGLIEKVKTFTVAQI